MSKVRDYVRTGLTVNRSTYAALKQLAAQENVSFNRISCAALAEFVSRHAQKTTPAA